MQTRQKGQYNAELTLLPRLCVKPLITSITAIRCSWCKAWENEHMQVIIALVLHFWLNQITAWVFKPIILRSKCKTNYFFTNNCRNSCTLIGLYLLSINRQTHEFIIYAMCQRVRVDNLTICYHKNKLKSVFLCILLLLTTNFAITLSM